jgi:hypothetical protein
MDVDVRMDLFLVKRVILGGSDCIGDAGTKLPQTVEIRLPEANCGVAGLELTMLLGNKNQELVIAVNSTHEHIVHSPGDEHKRFG